MDALYKRMLCVPDGISQDSITFLWAANNLKHELCLEFLTQYFQT